MLVEDVVLSLALNPEGMLTGTNGTCRTPGTPSLKTWY